jgi:hypothetical protein
LCEKMKKKKEEYEIKWKSHGEKKGRKARRRIVWFP